MSIVTRCVSLALGAAALSAAACATPVWAQAMSAGPVGLDGHQHDTVYVVCTAQAGKYCYFNILRARGGIMQVKILGPATQQVEDLEIGKDYFTAKIDSPAPTSLSACRASVGDSDPCFWGVVNKNIISQQRR